MGAGGVRRGGRHFETLSMLWEYLTGLSMSAKAYGSIKGERLAAFRRGTERSHKMPGERRPAADQAFQRVSRRI